MSRLPRLRSSPDPSDPPVPFIATTLGFSMSTSGYKRKAEDDLDTEALDQPRKLPAIGNGATARPLAASRSALNRPTTTTGPAAKQPSGPQRLTRPEPPKLSTSAPRRTTRATSAPPKQVGVSSGLIRPFGRVVSASRVASGSGLQTKEFRDLQSQVASIESTQLANAEKLAQTMDAERAKVAELEANHRALSLELANAKSLELDKRRELVSASDEIQKLRMKHAKEIMGLEMEMKSKAREARELADELRLAKSDLERERNDVSNLKATLSHQSTSHITLNAQINALQAQKAAMQMQLDALMTTSSDRTLELETAHRRILDLEQDARESEMVRRKLHNMVQELKGNIRVFCRVRPVLTSDLSPTCSFTSNPPDNEEKGREADITFPDKRDHKEIVVSSSSSSAMGSERKEVYNFGFDRVFEPESTQTEVFEEISFLAQSCVDGYNVCIFAYGQTGSGKSFTMEGGLTEATTGMIPRAVNQVFKAADDLKSKGWEYKMDGQFLEIYNETINDLLGKGEFDKKKHEIKHDKSGTRVTDVNVMPLPSPASVTSLLRVANSRRTVAATLMNERSSRSHSVFTLRISGTNTHTGESCEGSLNLVDLAGSERLNSSGAAGDKDRLKETQNINKSLSALGDVIAALGEKGEKGEKHIPYRNSKLTYLLQNSLSGNSKTLMILNLSPLAAHLNESLCSLRFATKVNNTMIGTAKKQIRGSS
ncbi:kinesin-domain-containing protein [Suillus bovinus]|uniref:kinesin-domain-containing protein n=1 Tax=Suillus bovinus TaxID=48563 RepID=UPI001B886587|nr:kinesin-domain-containing protein [Suillus bovinus]KAG2136065.1 kinesin-domain-containing protein [Suillus bovinus]